MSDLVVGGSRDHSAHLFDISHLFDAADPGRAVALSTLDGPADSIITVNFSPRGDRVVGGGSNASVWVWDITNRRNPVRYAELTAYPGRVDDTAYGLRGAILTGAGPDRSIRIWQTDPDRVAAALCRSGSSPLSAEEWQRSSPASRRVRSAVDCTLLFNGGSSVRSAPVGSALRSAPLFVGSLFGRLRSSSQLRFSVGSASSVSYRSSVGSALRWAPLFGGHSAVSPPVARGFRGFTQSTTLP